MKVVGGPSREGTLMLETYNYIIVVEHKERMKFRLRLKHLKTQVCTIFALLFSTRN